jgi:hypothetical protein
MNKHYVFMVFSVAVIAICAGIAYQIGYSSGYNTAKSHLSRPVYIKNNIASKSLRKILHESGLEVTPVQMRMINEQMKLERKSSK